MFSETVGIDLGTHYTRIYVKGQGIVLCEPTVAAIDYNSKRIICAGIEAEEMVGRTPKNVYSIRPLKHGIISDYRTTEKIIKHFIKKALGNRIFKPSALICVPGEISQVSERAVVDAALGAGMKNIELADTAVAAAMGAGIDISPPRGCMVADIGAENCDVAVISMGGIVSNRSIKTAGSSFDRAISEYIKREKRIIIGERAAGEVKMNIASLADDDKSYIVGGRCLLSGLPKTCEVTSAEIMPCIKNVAGEIVSAVKSVLENTPPQLLCDICDSGIYLCGGGASLRGLDRLIYENTGIKCIVAEEGSSCAIKGIGKLIENDMEVYN